MLLTGTVLLLTQCQPKDIPQTEADSLNKEFRINLNQTIALTGKGKTDLGEITFTHLNDSRCPTNSMCIRQGAAITSFDLQTTTAVKQNVRLFIGDFMPNDPRNRRNRTVDTVEVQLKDKTFYRLILKEVRPYPGTSTEKAEAIMVLEKA